MPHPNFETLRPRGQAEPLGGLGRRLERQTDGQTRIKSTQKRHDTCTRYLRLFTTTRISHSTRASDGHSEYRTDHPVDDG